MSQIACKLSPEQKTLVTNIGRVTVLSPVPKALVTNMRSGTFFTFTPYVRNILFSIFFFNFFYYYTKVFSTRSVIIIFYTDNRITIILHAFLRFDHTKLSAEWYYTELAAALRIYRIGCLVKIILNCNWVTILPNWCLRYDYTDRRRRYLKSAAQRSVCKSPWKCKHRK